MLIKRAILAGAVLWVLIFFEVSILMFGFKLSGALYYSIHYILLIFLTAIAAVTYFRGHVKAGAKQGLYVGLIMLLVGIILDAIITIPLFIKTYTFFLDPFLWIGFAEGLLIVTIIGAVKARK